MKFLNLKMTAIFFAVIFIILDVFLKNFFCLQPDLEYKIFPGLSLGQEANYGIAFSIPFARTPLLILNSCLLLAVIFYIIYCQKKQKFWPGYFALLILLGGASNHFDRLFIGFSRDFLKLGQMFDLVVWPNLVLNFADIFIFFGVVGLLFFSQNKFIKIKK